MSIGGKYARMEIGKGRFNYRYSRTITDGGDRVCTILYGGPNGHPNVEASGDRSTPLAQLLRAMGPHRVTRCDIASDFFEEGSYSELRRIGLSVARQYGLKKREVSSPGDDSEGSTLYVGSRQSSLFLRIYEKGKKERAEYRQRHDIPIDWVRCELEVKPQKEMKEAAAAIAPADFWGASPWTANFAKEALSMAPEPISFHPRRMASDERAYRFMVAQYRNLMQRRLEAKFDGDRDAMARQLVSDFLGHIDDVEAA